MISSPTISVILPVYNSEKYIDKCIESILNQSLTDYQLIIVDDGSTDKSLDICKKYEAIDSRIVLISVSNGGVSKARNIGLNNAVGKYIFFIDSDDYIHSKTLEILYTKAIEYDGDLVVGNYSEVKNYSEKSINCEVNEKDVNIKSGIELLKESYATENTLYLAVWNKLIKRELIKGLRFPEDIFIGEDHYICNILYFNARKVIIIQNITYFYYINNLNSITKSNLTIDSVQQVEAYEKEYIFFKEKDKDKDILNILLKRILLTCIHLRYIADKKGNKYLYKELEDKINKYKYEKDYIFPDSKMKIIKIYIKFKVIYEIKIKLYKFYSTNLRSKKKFLERLFEGKRGYE